MGENMDKELEARILDHAFLLVSRLERISPDSSWAHRVSGYRGSLLRNMDQIALNNQLNKDPQWNEAELERLRLMVDAGFVLLAKLAKEMAW